MKNIIVLFLLVLCVTSCVAPPKTILLEMEKIERIAGKGRVFIYRPSMTGEIFWPRIFIDGKAIADLPAKTFTYKHLSPGKYRLDATRVYRVEGGLCTGRDDCSHSILIDISANEDIYLIYEPLSSNSYVEPTGVGGVFVNTSQFFGLRKVVSEEDKKTHWFMSVCSI